jgi:hypothetical protein
MAASSSAVVSVRIAVGMGLLLGFHTKDA